MTNERQPRETSPPLGTVRNLAFDHSWPSILAGAKTRQRISWTRYQAQAVRPGQLLAAWTGTPGLGSARHIAWIVVIEPRPSIVGAHSGTGTGTPDWVSIGFEYFDKHPEQVPLDRSSPFCQSPNMRSNFHTYLTSTTYGPKKSSYALNFRVVGLTSFGRHKAEAEGIEVPDYLDDPWPGDALRTFHRLRSDGLALQDHFAQADNEESIRGPKIVQYLHSKTHKDDPILAARLSTIARRKK